MLPYGARTMEMPVLQLDLAGGEESQHQENIIKPDSASSQRLNPAVFLKPSPFIVNHGTIEGDFYALARRTGSTSTPFPHRTASTASSTMLTPCISDCSTYSMNDSAIEATCSINSSRCSVDKSIPFALNSISNDVEMQSEDLSEENIPKVSLFQTLRCDKCGLLSPVQQRSNVQSTHHKISKEVDISSSGQSVYDFPKTFSKHICAQCSDHQSNSRSSEQILSETVASPTAESSHCENLSSLSQSSPLFHEVDKLKKQSDSLSTLYSEGPDSFSLTEDTPDTGYESQIGLELTSSMESSGSAGASCSSFSLFLDRFVPKHLDQLIGRKIGLEQVDIIVELHRRNQCIPLNIILSYLSRKDLKNMCDVSSEWNATVESDFQAFRRKNTSKSSRKMEGQKENCYQKKRGDGRQLTTPKGLLAEVQYTAVESSVTPSLRPASLHCDEAQQALDLSQKYWKEAESLKNEESLRKCPKCRSPAKVNPTQERAWCSGESCKFDFCIKCHRDFHGSKECAIAISVKKLKTDVKVGSKRSKKNLRRL